MTGSFDIPYVDKIAHVIVFGVFVALWCLYFNTKNYSPKKRGVVFFFIFLIGMVNGIIVEYVQLYFIPNRSFDQGDIIADIISAGISYGICNVALITGERKNLPRR